MRTATTPTGGRPLLRSAVRRRPRSATSRVAPYVFVLPNVLLVLVFAIYPLLSNVGLSFTGRNLDDFVGLENYRRMVDDRAFAEALKNTLYYTVLLVPPTVVLSLAAAVAMNRKVPFQKTIRAAFLLPYLISWSVVGLIWRLMFSSDSGILNRMLRSVGLPQVDWLLDPQMVIPSLALVGIWAGVGYYMVIYIAALQGIPSVLYEAAKIDGASTWEQFRFITLPALRPITSMISILALIASFRVFEQIYVMTGGGPGRSSFVLVLYIFIQAFSEFSISYAATIAVVLFASLLALTALLRRITRDED
jgi:multiple sugar transport system permease protein